MFKSFITAVMIAFTTLVCSATQTATTKLKWDGHSAFEITTPRGHVIVIDPWLNNPTNPAAQNGKNAVDAVEKADYILITHGHFDHLADAVALAKKTKARLITNFELGTNLVRALGFPQDQVGIDSLTNAGGEIPILDGEVIVAATTAIHSSGLDTSSDGKNPIIYGGNPIGFVLKIKNGPTIYHSGDTAYFAEMTEIGKYYHPDVALLNIGGHFGMEADQAAHAAQSVQAKLVIPHHYKTFPVLAQSAKPFFKLLDELHIAHYEMQPGQTIEFAGTKLKQ